MNLAELPFDGSVTATVTSIALPDEEAAWVRAVGIFEGEAVSVLRAALFGGPLHVRTASGGEFAIDRRLALAIVVRPTEAVAKMTKTRSEVEGAPDLEAAQ